MFVNMLKVYEIMGLGFLESDAAQIWPATVSSLYEKLNNSLSLIFIYRF